MGNEAAGQQTQMEIRNTEAFHELVLSATPRIAVFDFDGTLWPGDSGEGFFRWSIARGMLGVEAAQSILARYDDYLAGKVGESEMCGEMVQMYAGWDEEGLRAAATEYVNEHVKRQHFKDMLALTEKLTAAGAELWAVSSTNEWVVAAGAKYFWIPPERVLAVKLELDAEKVTDRLVHVPSGPDKAVAIRKHVKGEVDACFGNSIHDLEMLEVARMPVAVNPNAALKKAAAERGWKVYWPEATRS